MRVLILCRDLVNGRQILMFGGNIIANVCEYNILRFGANKTLVPAKINSHLKVLVLDTSQNFNIDAALWIIH